MIGFAATKKKSEDKATESVLLNKGPKKKKVQAFKIRLQKDMAELDDVFAKNIKYENEEKQEKFTINIIPTEGIWKDHPHTFEVKVTPKFPYQPPKVTCLTKIWHPNIDSKGAVCLNILKVPPHGNWKPVLTMNAVFIGLNFLFQEPNPDDPLDKEPAEMYADDKKKFIRIAKEYMRGKY
mmetsp:Transcript_202/g.348  ORF Transcript_202/g.348 Transcript_202/m.348 type:complete len:180 (-) Transcript_202:1944-2483(-)